MSDRLAACLIALRPEIWRVLDGAKRADARALVGHLDNWEGHRATMDSLCKSEAAAWQRLTAQWQALPVDHSQPPMPSALRQPPRELMKIDRVHRLQSALTNSWALYEFTWLHFVWPPVPQQADQSFDLKSLTQRPKNEDFLRKGANAWAVFIIWNTVGIELERLWKIRCIAVHEPGRLLTDDFFVPVAGLTVASSWVVRRHQLNELCNGSRQGEDNRKVDLFKGDGDSLDLIVELSRARDKVDFAIGKIVQQTVAVAASALQVYDELSSG